ncbi:hypothetical protein Plim_4001 [Planctopirus limnophila DSM 3776]|uniref:Uncharacterized protein n=1 Tax=Planctopirus limnophila (strain ATCC 43296 / DSM 3776 / IFAM 1008 / Mu 290) TaxID=521674 RepID=D5SY19_PLAL2|nr:hypothetical protein [Planctopirus limnophila]ADG69812.1 hypothetical protein Plim_4001 [Planctopirus limnophila DSM 3776]
MNFWWWLRTLVLAVAAIVLGVIVTYQAWYFTRNYVLTLVRVNWDPSVWYSWIVDVTILGLIPSAAGGLVSTILAAWSLSWRTLMLGLLITILTGGMARIYMLWELSRHTMGVQGLAWWMLLPLFLPAISGTLFGFIMRYANAKQQFA